MAPFQQVPERLDFRMFIKRFLQVFLTLALVLAIAAGFAHSSDVRNATTLIGENETHTLDLARQGLATSFERILSDLYYLAELPEIQGHALDNAELASEFLLFAKQKRMYDQIRLMNLTGMELIAINYNHGAPLIATLDQPQSKEQRYHFRNALDLNNSEVYVSPLALNTAGDQIEEPLKPLIRFGTPVFDAQGRKIGVVMLNYFGADLLTMLSHISAPSAGTVMLLNADGYWLKGPTHQDEWGFVFPDRQTRTFGNTYPDAWSQISHAEQGQFFTSDGLFTFVTVHPLLDGLQASTAAGEALATSRAQLTARQYTWKIVTHIPQAVFDAQSNQALLSLLPRAVIGLLILASIAYMLARAIVHRRMAEQTLHQQYDFMQKLIDTIPAPVYYKDTRGAYRGCNRAYEEFYGVTAADLIGKTAYDIHPQEIAEQYTALDHALLAQTGAQQHEARARRADGDARDILLNKATYTDAHGNLAGIVGMALDITERKEMETRLDRLAHFNENIVQSIGEGIMMDDTEGHVVFANPAACAILGYAPSELIGMHWSGFIAPDQHTHIEQTNQQRAAGASGRYEVEVLRQDGRRLTVMVSGQPRIEDGAYVGTLAVFSDITERKQVEERLRQLSRAVEQSPVSIVITDTQGAIEYANPEFTEVTGYTLAEALGQNPRILKSGETPPEEYARLWQQISAGGQWRGEFHNKKKNGELYWESASISAVTDEHGKITHYLAVKEDITARKAIERKLADERNQLNTILENLPAMVFIKDPTGRYVFSNREHMRFLGFDQTHGILGKTAADLFDSEFAERVRADDAKVLRDGLTIVNREENSADPVTCEMRWRLTTKVPLRDIAGNITGLLGISRDMTERKCAEEELRAAKDTAEAATRAKSEFLANMSHEIRTPMNAVIGMTSLLLDTPLTEQQRDFCQTIRASGDALLAIINDILDFSKIESGRLELERQPFEVARCAEEALDLLAARASQKGLDLAYTIDASVPEAIIGDITRLRQILVNLLGNAVKFTDTGEVIIAVTGTAPAENMYDLHFAVKDSGIGIPPDRMDRLFKSFSQVDASTTRRYGGTGLGLVISKRLAEMMGGAMWVESTGVPGEGTTFHFTIRALASPHQPNLNLRSIQPQLSGLRALIVDDNATNRKIIDLQLRAWGMTPTTAASGAEALALIQRGDRFDIAILDMQMPEMDGLTLAAEIRKQRDANALPLVMLTSIGSRAEAEGATNVRFAAYLSKPIKASQLYNALVDVFAKRPVRAPQLAAQPQMDATMGTRHPLRLLLAEDNLVNQKVALLILQKMGYRADVAGNGLETLDALRRQTYDVVLMDVQMPELDGLDATRRIRAEFDPAQQPRIIAMTAEAMQGDREICLAAGMDDYITKPVRVEELARALERATPLVEIANPEPATAQPTADVLDAHLLTDLREVTDGDMEPLIELVNLFQVNAPSLIEAIRQAASNHDADAMRRAAHTLKSASANLGAHVLADVCKEIEEAVRSGKQNGADPTARVEREYARALDALRAYTAKT
ncbi:MAG: PAS domain S-box protein [Chloroflexi bacterium]|nr:PAS domain S-box protein [Chloroflexota bacterium]